MCMRYADGGGLTARGRAARERVRLQATGMFEQRVPSHVRERTDFFQDELVRTLANGDASLLELRSET